MDSKPSDLDIDAGRSALVLVPTVTFKEITKLLNNEKEFSQEFLEILASILEELDHTTIKEYFDSLTQAEQESIDQAFEKHDLVSSLEYLVT